MEVRQELRTLEILYLIAAGTILTTGLLLLFLLIVWGDNIRKFFESVVYCFEARRGISLLDIRRDYTARYVRR
jgi:hypothetical protein